MAHDASVTFYETAAQIIPVLFLVMAVGESKIKTHNAPKGVILGSLAILPILAAAEVAALAAVANGSGTGLASFLTRLGLATGLFYVLMLFAIRIVSESAATSPRFDPRLYGFIAGIPVGMVVAAVFLFITP
jgi:hypothetical protein